MTPRRWAATALLLLAALALLWSAREQTPTAFSPTPTPVPRASPEAESFPSPEAPTIIEPGLSRAPAMATPTFSVTPEVARPPVPPPLPAGQSADIEKQLDAIHLMLRDYRSLTGANPVGTNAEIMQAIVGDNPRQATLGPPPGQALNAAGELVDPWGTPYFFHQLSGREMEIRSAGPDRAMWTSDDQTIVSATGSQAPARR